MVFIQYFTFGAIFFAVLLLCFKLFYAENFISALILCSAISSIITIALAIYSIFTKNSITLDAICLFYLTSHMIPLIYSIVILYKNAKTQSA